MTWPIVSSNPMSIRAHPEEVKSSGQDIRAVKEVSPDVYNQITQPVSNQNTGRVKLPGRQISARGVSFVDAVSNRIQARLNDSAAGMGGVQNNGSAPQSNGPPPVGGVVMSNLSDAVDAMRAGTLQYHPDKIYAPIDNKIEVTFFSDEQRENMAKMYEDAKDSAKKYIHNFIPAIKEGVKQASILQEKGYKYSLPNGDVAWAPKPGSNYSQNDIDFQYNLAKQAGDMAYRDALGLPIATAGMAVAPEVTLPLMRLTPAVEGYKNAKGDTMDKVLAGFRAATYGDFVDQSRDPNLQANFEKNPAKTAANYLMAAGMALPFEALPMVKGAIPKIAKAKSMEVGQAEVPVQEGVDVVKFAPPIQEQAAASSYGSSPAGVSPKPPVQPGTLDAYIREASQTYGVNEDVLRTLIQHESSNKADAISPAGAIGYTQLMKGTAKGLGYDPYDPRQNVLGGAKYLRQQLDAFGGDLEKALAAYNAGPAAVQKYGGVPPYPETRNYVKGIMGDLKGKDLSAPKVASSGTIGQSIPLAPEAAEELYTPLKMIGDEPETAKPIKPIETTIPLDQQWNDAIQRQDSDAMSKVADAYEAQGDRLTATGIRNYVSKIRSAAAAMPTLDKGTMSTSAIVSPELLERSPIPAEDIRLKVGADETGNRVGTEKSNTEDMEKAGYKSVPGLFADAVPARNEFRGDGSGGFFVGNRGVPAGRMMEGGLDILDAMPPVQSGVKAALAEAGNIERPSKWDHVSIQAAIRPFIDKPQAAMPYLVDIGKQVLREGYNRGYKWSVKMREYLGNTWKHFGRYMTRVWSYIHNERGQLGRGDAGSGALVKQGQRPADVGSVNRAGFVSEGLSKAGEEIGNVGKNIAKGIGTGETLAKNRESGREFEKESLEKMKENNDNVVEQITVKTKSGTKTRLDGIGVDKKTGTIVIEEYKASPTAPFTKNQKITHPEIAESGATVVGKGKEPFVGGTKISPTKINVIRKTRK